MKPVKFSIAVAVKNSEGKILAVKRPPDDDSLPDVWGLPAITTKQRELPEDAARRIGTEKLDCQIRIVGTVGIKTKDRGKYELTLLEFEAEPVDGNPDVLEATTDATQYVEQKWTNDPMVFMDAARKGSLCSQVFLDSKGIAY